MKNLKYVFTIFAAIIFSKSFSQVNASVNLDKTAKSMFSEVTLPDSARQKDLIDIFQKLFDKKISLEKRKLPPKASYAIIPYVGYTLSTGFTADVSGNVGFYTTKDHNEYYSVVTGDFGYDTKNQRIFLSRSEIWTSGNKYKVVSDLRFELYPTDTYGLGTATTFATDNKIDFSYVRVFETLLRKIKNDFYAGVGYNLDYHYNITASGNADNTATDFAKYGQTTRSTSSGFTLNFLYDHRKNPINPSNGGYASVIYRQNLTLLGSNANWQELQFDFRRYFKLSENSNNVLAFWSIVALTSGNVPYLDMPATGGDMYNNSGRGYAVGRYRGKNELYFEGAYRFGLSKNGLLGAVVFANAESFSGLQSNALQRFAPAVGTGLRIKINKHSGTNICIDYGVGTNGSHGFFVNLGEVF